LIFAIADEPLRALILEGKAWQNALGRRLMARLAPSCKDKT